VQEDSGPPDQGPGDLGPPPTAEQVCPAAPFLGDAVLLDGSSSRGPGLQYEWLVEAPPGAAAQVQPAPSGADAEGKAELRVLWPGSYEIRLRIRDAHGRTAQSRICPLQVPGFDLYARQQAHDLAPDARGRVWVASDLGVHRLDPQVGAWTALSDTPCDAVEVAGESAWLIPKGADGLLRVALDAEAAGSQEPVGLPAVQRARSLRVAPDGALWVGGLGGVRVIADGEEGWRGQLHDPPGDQDEVRALLFASEGLWLGRTSGVCLWATPGDVECARELTVLTDGGGAPVDPLLLDLALDPTGALVAATDGKGLHRLGDVGFAPLAAGAEEAVGRVTRFASAPGGELWLATAQRVYRLDAAGRLHGVELPRGQRELGTLRSLRSSDSPPTLWLAGSAGVARVVGAR